jgi:serine protease SohB
MIRKFLTQISGGLIPPAPPVVGVLRLEGMILSGLNRGRGLSLEALESAIERLFSLKRLVAVAVVINSPGGAPGQSSLIHSRLRQRAAEAKLPLIAFAEDVAASGGYWLALAGDEIFATEASLIGSIGVVTAGFGFTDLIAKLGVERRVYTAGESKAMLDPFRPEKPEDVARLKELQEDLHTEFKTLVRARRGEKLKETPEMFSGAVFTGNKALGLGLIDGIGEMRGVMRQRYGEKVLFAPIATGRQGLLRRLFGGGRRGILHDAAIDLLATIEERSLWARFGL